MTPKWMQRSAMHAGTLTHLQEHVMTHSPLLDSSTGNTLLRRKEVHTLPRYLQNHYLEMLLRNVRTIIFNFYSHSY